MLNSRSDRIDFGHVTRIDPTRPETTHNRFSRQTSKCVKNLLGFLYGIKKKGIVSCAGSDQSVKAIIIFSSQ